MSPDIPVISLFPALLGPCYVAVIASCFSGENLIFSSCFAPSLKYRFVVTGGLPPECPLIEAMPGREVRHADRQAASRIPHARYGQGLGNAAGLSRGHRA